MNPDPIFPDPDELSEQDLEAASGGKKDSLDGGGGYSRGANDGRTGTFAPPDPFGGGHGKKGFLP